MDEELSEFIRKDMKARIEEGIDELAELLFGDVDNFKPTGILSVLGMDVVETNSTVDFNNPQQVRRVEAMLLGKRLDEPVGKVNKIEETEDGLRVTGVVDWSKVDPGIREKPQGCTMTYNLLTMADVVSHDPSICDGGENCPVNQLEAGIQDES